MTYRIIEPKSLDHEANGHAHMIVSYEIAEPNDVGGMLSFTVGDPFCADAVHGSGYADVPVRVHKYGAYDECVDILTIRWTTQDDTSTWRRKFEAACRRWLETHGPTRFKVEIDWSAPTGTRTEASIERVVRSALLDCGYSSDEIQNVVATEQP